VSPPSRPRRPRRVAGRRAQGGNGRGHEEQKRQGRIGFISGIAGVLIAVVALVVSYLSLREDMAGTRRSTNPDLKVVEFSTSTVSKIPEQSWIPGVDEERESGTINAAAATITVLNSGEEPGLLTSVRVKIREVLRLQPCAGAGAVEATAQYDVRVPDELDARSLPKTFDVPVKFEVAGKDVDELAVSIGPERYYDGQYPWIYVVDISLVERSGSTLVAGTAVLIDTLYAEDIKVFSPERPVDEYERPCNAENLRMVDHSVGVKGRHSAELLELQRSLRASIQGVAGSKPTTEEAPRVIAGEDSIGTWIVQLESLPQPVSSQQVEDSRRNAEQRLGVPVQVLNSSDFASLNPNYFVVYYAGGFATGEEAVAFCVAHGLGANDACFGRYLSHDSADRDLRCYPTGSLKPSICRK